MRSLYAALSTRPDISYAISTISHFCSNPRMPHWEAVQRIYRYLIGTKDLRLTYGWTRKPLQGYMDTDGSMSEDRKAVSGYAFLIDGSTMSWASKKQEIISLSTTESEYVAATHAMKEALWLCYGCARLLEKFSSLSTNPSLYFQTTNPLSHSPKTTNTTCAQNTLTYASTSSAG